MLQILRKKAQSTFIQIIVVIIALVFIFWGVGANLGGDRQAALTVNDEKITFQEFQRAYDQAYQRLSDQFGGNVPKGLAETLGVKQQVIIQLIQTALLRQGAREMGLQVSAEEIQQLIAEMVQFQENGLFNIERYKAVLAANRLAPTKFEESMRFDRLSEVAAREIGNFASEVTDIEIQEVYSRQNEKVAVKYVKVSPDRFVDKVTIDDNALKAWFATVKENYQSEPRIKLKYLTFTYDKIGRKIAIDESKIE
jgi:peptidyl-prolyl cis-trans isomerase D